MSEQLTVRQFATKAIHEDNLNLRNPSILAKLLNDYASIKCREQRDKCHDIVIDHLPVSYFDSVEDYKQFLQIILDAPEPTKL